MSALTPYAALIAAAVGGELPPGEVRLSPCAVTINPTRTVLWCVTCIQGREDTPSLFWDRIGSEETHLQHLAIIKKWWEEQTVSEPDLFDLSLGELFA